MKSLFLSFIFVILLSSSAIASSSITFIWDANQEGDLAGYALFQSDTSGVYDFAIENAVADISAGIETHTITNVPDGTWYYVLIAYDNNDNCSGASSEASLTLDTIPPGSPTGFKHTVVIKIY